MLRGLSPKKYQAALVIAQYDHSTASIQILKAIIYSAPNNKSRLPGSFVLATGLVRTSKRTNISQAKPRQQNASTTPHLQNQRDYQL